jgi:hypothetical protein
MRSQTARLVGLRLFIFAGLAGVLACKPSSPPRQLLEVASQEFYDSPDPSCKLQNFKRVRKDSELAVFEDGVVRHHVLEGRLCFGDDRPETVSDPRWGFRWADSQEKSFQFKLGIFELIRLKRLLNRDDIKRLDGYANAGPAVGDFKITIDRAQGPQKFEVLGFQPAYSWTQNPPLTDLICEAKTIARLASKTGESPAWCKTRPRN